MVENLKELWYINRRTEPVKKVRNISKDKKNGAKAAIAALLLS